MAVKISEKLFSRVKGSVPRVSRNGVLNKYKCVLLACEN